MKKYLLTLGAVALAAPSHAAVVTGDLTGGSAAANGGVFQLLTPGPGFSVGNNQQQSNNLFAFDELSNATLGSNITAAFGGALTAGQMFSSHFVFFDPDPTRTAIGTVTFDSDIIAVLTSDANMNATDADFGLAGINYMTPALRGLEGQDSFSVAGNVLSIDWRASNPGDYIRVLTAPAVPEPATWAMMILGFGMVGFSIRRRKQAVRVSYG